MNRTRTLGYTAGRLAQQQAVAGSEAMKEDAMDTATPADGVAVEAPPALGLSSLMQAVDAVGPA